MSLIVKTSTSITNLCLKYIIGVIEHCLLTHLPYTTAKTLLCLDPTELKGRLQPKSVDG